MKKNKKNKKNKKTVLENYQAKKAQINIIPKKTIDEILKEQKTILTVNNIEKEPTKTPYVEDKTPHVEDKLSREIKNINQLINMLVNDWNEGLRSKLEKYTLHSIDMINYSIKETKNKNNIHYVQGDVYLADLGVREGSCLSGKRPVVIIQNAIGLKHSPLCKVVPLSTKPSSEQKTQVSLVPSDFYNGYNDEEDYSVDIFGTALCEQAIVISKGQLLHKLGELKSFKLQKILAATTYNVMPKIKYKSLFLKELINLDILSLEDLQQVLNDYEKQDNV